MIKVSIIIAIYNAAEYLTECLDSILMQSLDEIEVICIDDGSTDSSGAILEEYRKNNSKIVVISQNNQGTGNAKNLGIQNSRGEFFCFMDADDFYPNDHCLEMLYDTAKKEKVSICGGSLYNYCYGTITKVKDMVFDNSCRWSYEQSQILYGHTRFIYNTEMIKENGVSCLPYRRYEEQSFFVNAMSIAKSYYTIPQCVYVYRVGHKVQKMGREDVKGLLIGIRETLLVAESHDYDLLYEKYLNQILKYQLKWYCAYVEEGDEEICNILEEIWAIEGRWKGKRQRDVFNKEALREIIDSCRTEINKIRMLKDKDAIIIYGVGTMGSWIYDRFLRTNNGVIGFAVTTGAEKEIKVVQDTESIPPVRNIDSYLQYRDSAKVIVAVMDDKIQNQICDNLHDLGFCDYVRINAERLILAADIEKNNGLKPSFVAV